MRTEDHGVMVISQGVTQHQFQIALTRYKPSVDRASDFLRVEVWIFRYDFIF